MLVKLAHVAKRPQVENTHFSLPGALHRGQCPKPQAVLQTRAKPSSGLQLREHSWQFLFVFHPKSLGAPLPILQGKAGRAPVALEGYRDTWSWMPRREQYFPSFCNFLCSEYSGCASDHPSCSVPLLTLVAEQSSPLMEGPQTLPFLFMQQCWKKACMSHLKGVLLLCYFYYFKETLC